MPIDHRIDHTRRLVLARGFGVVSAEDLYRYHGDVWSRPEVAGYDELVDMTGVERIVEPTEEAVRTLATVAARDDAPGTSSRFAIVAPQDLTYGLGRMYQTFRGLVEQSTKQVEVFRDRAEALAWLGHDDSG